MNEGKPQNHSPLPWRLTSQMNRFSVKSHNELFIASDIRQLEDAQFIVQACNAHGVLLQACKDALYYLRQCEMDFSLPPSAKTMKDILTEAIAKAEASHGN